MALEVLKDVNTNASYKISSRAVYRMKLYMHLDES